MRIKERKEEERISFWRYFVVLLILLPVLFLISLFSPLKSWTRNIFLPFGRVFQDSLWGVKKVFLRVKILKETEKENTLLKKRLLVLMQENAALKMRNEELIALLKDSYVSLEETPKKKIFARVIGREPATFLREIVLDKGSKDGVEVGQAVTIDGVLIAKVEEVQRDAAKALFINSYLAITQVRHNQNRITATARGGIGGLRIFNFPKEASLAEGDLFVTSGLDPKIPAGLIVGTVKKVFDSKASFFKGAILEQPYDSLPENVIIYGK